MRFTITIEMASADNGIAGAKKTLLTLPREAKCWRTQAGPLQNITTIGNLLMELPPDEQEVP